VGEYVEPMRMIGHQSSAHWLSSLTTQFGVTSKEVVRRVFIACHHGKTNPDKQNEGAGWKHRLLDCDNAGLIAGVVAALNGSSVSPNMATESMQPMAAVN
jgi:hypothetical protein